MDEEDYGSVPEDWFENSTSHIDPGHTLANIILSRKNSPKFSKDNQENNELNKEDLKYIKFYKAMNNLKVNPKNIFNDPAGKVKQLENYLGVFKLKIKGGVERELPHCKDYEIGKAFLSYYNKGKNLSEKFDN
ncbi:hypothetical protein GW931_02900 [archaeon]|nr:hypothetical protein [archaeon]PJC45545.1 MAG: hypothetical protein CO037_00925 [Candidatus Pacearchaeota archaeon CG_4_9_14_0_2_um_filter_30_8]